MKFRLTILLFFILPVLAAAQPQQRQLDSLHMVLKNAPNDTIRMDVYNSLGLYFAEINRDSSLLFREKALSFARQLQLKINEADILVGHGYLLMLLGNYPGSLQSELQALKILQDPSLRKNPFPLSHAQSSSKDRLGTLAAAHFALGLLYNATGNIDKKIASYQETRKIAENIRDTDMLAVTYASIGESYYALDKLDSALIFEEKALPYFSAEDKYKGLVFGYIGLVYQRKGNFSLSRENLFEAIKLLEKSKNLSALGSCLVSLAGLYQTAGKTDSAFLYARKGLETFTSLHQPAGIASAYNMLSSIYQSENKTDSAFAYLKLATTLRDSLNNIERKNLLAFQDVGFNEQMRVEALQKENIQTQNRIRTYAMLAGLGVFLVIGLILYRNNRQKQKANKILETTLVNLKSTQSQLIQSEKMASLGELTAGIAHEIQNPLNFVNNFSEVNKELVDELQVELKAGKIDDAIAVSNEIKENEEKINHHGKRADAIVKGMLQHSRSSNGVKEPTDINALADEYFRLAYHGLRAKDKSFNATMKTDFDNTIGKIDIIPQDIGRVILNLINNAFYAVDEKKKANQNGYEPTVSVSIKKINDKVEIRVADNGKGISQKVFDKIFQPFFTTKPTGQGTGLGLSLSYDIVKAHGGEIKVQTKEGEGTEFTLILPS